MRRLRHIILAFGFYCGAMMVVAGCVMAILLIVELIERLAK